MHSFLKAPRLLFSFITTMNVVATPTEEIESDRAEFHDIKQRHRRKEKDISAREKQLKEECFLA